MSDFESLSCESDLEITTKTTAPTRLRSFFAHKFAKVLVSVLTYRLKEYFNTLKMHYKELIIYGKKKRSINPKTKAELEDKQTRMLRRKELAEQVVNKRIKTNGELHQGVLEKILNEKKKLAERFAQNRNERERKEAKRKQLLRMLEREKMSEEVRDLLLKVNL